MLNPNWSDISLRNNDAVSSAENAKQHTLGLKLGWAWPDIAHFFNFVAMHCTQGNGCSISLYESLNFIENMLNNHDATTSFT